MSNPLEQSSKKRLLELTEDDLPTKRVALVQSKTIVDSPEDGHVVHFKKLFPQKVLDDLERVIDIKTHGAPETFQMFGKAVVSTRRVCAFGDAGLVYKYSDNIPTPLRPMEDLEPVRTELEQRFKCRFNYCIVNEYPDGKAKVGYHADDEQCFVENSPIVSVSIGGPRTFMIRRKRAKAAPGQPRVCGNYKDTSVVLESGAVLLMDKNTQSVSEHAVPVRASQNNRCISLTFRVMKK